MKKPLNNRTAGGMAEQIARACLEKKGYQVLAMNWYCGHLELDIIALDDRELVIVEVKSRHGVRFEHPSEAITQRKIRQIIEAAGSYVEATGWEGETRFDLITVIFTGKGEYELEHYEDAFNPEA